MAALQFRSAPSSSAQLFHSGRSSPHCNSSRSSPSSRGSPPVRTRGCSAAFSDRGRSFRERFSEQGPMRMQMSRIERFAWTTSRTSILGSISSRENFWIGPSAYRGDDLLYLLSDYDGEGPIELPPREIEIDPFAIPEANPAQIVASIVLTGAIVVLLFRSIRRRAARSKGMQFRSSGVSNVKSVKEEARKAVIDNLTKAPEVPTPPPSPANTAFGAIVAGIIALGLYKFTSTVESGFSVKAVSQDYTIRNLTITVRTIITGVCYLATFVFAANSIGLTLYAFQLLLGSDVPDSSPPSDSVQNEESRSDDKLETEDVGEK